MEKQRFGSVYINSRPVKNAAISEQSFMIWDTYSAPDLAMSWIRVGGIWICDETVITDISLRTLEDKYRYRYGNILFIDGKTYLCRSLRVGTNTGEANEWDAALDEVGDDDEIWHCKRIAFFGQDECQSDQTVGFVRGKQTSRNWDKVGADYKDLTLGFRPVLEPLRKEDQLSYDIVGQTVFVRSHCDMVAGQLLDYTDYDLVLRPDVSINRSKKYSNWVTSGSDEQMFVRRDSMVQLYAK